MTRYEMAATGIAGYWMEQVRMVEEGTKTLDEAYMCIEAYLRALKDCDLCGEGYAANILEQVMVRT
jgi:hypothetical protein